ncbi:MAG: hypothetical protein M1812_001428 [Candelaria pacifica]|nr:MAG: hypothetical protein M1812_001428 [Candelaria pacifica]
MVVVFWGITPLQSGIFATSTITLTENIPLWTSNASVPKTPLSVTSDIDYLYSVFGISWLNETLPPFMTREYALAPFGTTNPENLKNEETWTATTQLYGMDLDCDTAIAEDSNTNKGYTYSDPQMMRFYSGRGCRTQLIKSDISSSASYLAYYAGYYDNGYADYYLSPDCPKNSSHVSFIVWTKTRQQSTEPVGDAAALFCEPKYYYQDVKASVSASSGKVLNISVPSSKMPLPEGLFNSTTFETELTSGSQVTREREDVPSGIMPDPNHRLQDMDIMLPTNIYMVGYAIAAEKRRPADYLDPEVLKHSFQSAYRLLFARFFVDVLKSRSVKDTPHSGVRNYRTEAAILVPTFAYLVEGLLAMTAALATGLLYIHTRRPRKLTGDPAAIATTMSLVADSSELPGHFSGLEYLSHEEFERSLQCKNFRLAQPLHGQAYSLEVVDTQKKSYHFQFNQMFRKKRACRDGLKRDSPALATRPFEFGIPAAVGFITILLFLLVFIATLHKRVQILDGLPRPSANRLVRQLILNYIPTAVATFLEPVWVVLNRLLCILQPFEELRRGKAAPSASLTSTYTSLPPQLVFWRAFRAKHYILTAVCSMALLANLLAVSLSGLFFESTISKPTAQIFSQPYSPLLLRSLEQGFSVTNNSLDHFYVARTNVTLATQLPPWTDDGRFFLPFLPQTKGYQRYRASTSTFGVQLDCVQLLPETPNSVDFKLGSNGLGARLLVNMTREDGRSVSCQPRVITNHPSILSGSSPSDTNNISFQGVPRGSVGAELSVAMDSTAGNRSTTEDTNFCQELIVSGWLRANLSLIENQLLTSDQNVSILSSDQMFMGCRPSLRIGVSEVLVDELGHVMDASPTKVDDTKAQQYFKTRPTELYAYLTQSIANNGAIWHNDSFPSDWTNYLMKHMYNTTDMLDPTMSAPQFAVVMPRFQALYSMLSAILLGTNTDILFVPSNGSHIQGQVLLTTPRVFISKPMFIISQTILGMYLVVAVIMYIFRPGKFLPRLPTTIASVVSLVYRSHALADFKGTAQMPPKQREKHLEVLGNKYGYGRYIGTDGQAHVGIERQPLFVDLHKETDLGGGWI